MKVECPFCSAPLFTLAVISERGDVAKSKTDPKVQSDERGHFVYCSSCEERVELAEARSPSGFAGYRVTSNQGAFGPKKVWRLEPSGPKSAVWQASTYYGTVFVRAETERRARSIASSAFTIATRRSLGQKITAGPWKQPSQVSASEDESGSYSLEGQSELVGPPEALRHL